PVDGFHCNASFVHSIDSNKVKFDSHESQPGAYDSIISRTWSFGDSTYADGNIIDLLHEYKDTGWYYACLTIKTKKGCENTTCEHVRIETQHETDCSAKFEYAL